VISNCGFLSDSQSVSGLLSDSQRSSNEKGPSLFRNDFALLCVHDWHAIVHATFWLLRRKKRRILCYTMTLQIIVVLGNDCTVLCFLNTDDREVVEKHHTLALKRRVRSMSNFQLLVIFKKLDLELLPGSYLLAFCSIEYHT
jgi:hypothetical protein